MNLNEYLKKEKISSQEFSRISGVAPSHISIYRRGQGKPASKNMSKIIKATNGLVTVEDFIESAPDNPE